MIAKCLHFAFKKYIIKIVNKAKEKGNAKWLRILKRKPISLLF